MTLIMGVLNVTPDSFSDGGRYDDAERAIAHGLALSARGADVIDIGGESTRPGAERVSPDIERSRVLPVIEALAAAGVTVSVDTMNASTAIAAVEAGARIVNDVSGGLADPEMLSAVAEIGADVVLQHWRGASSDMYANARYDDVIREVIDELVGRIQAAAKAGIPPARMIIDPGIGFGKQGEQNWATLRATRRIVAMGHRVLIGTSRKRFLAETLGPDEPGGDTVSEHRRDLATAVTSVLAADAGVWAVRVHDVGATKDALRIAEAWRGEDRWKVSTRSD